MAKKLSASGSFVLFWAFLACGISFFSPWWLENTPAFLVNHKNYLAIHTLERVFTDADLTLPITVNNTLIQPNTTTTFGMGLWAICDDVCQWFWEDYYVLQVNLFTKLKWHLACQVLYFVACSIVLMAEIYSKIQLCGRERRLHYRILWISLLLSAILQICTLAVFGAGSLQTYSAQSFSKPIWQQKLTPTVMMGWSYWMAIPGIILTTTATILFLIADIWTFRDKI